MGASNNGNGVSAALDEIEAAARGGGLDTGDLGTAYRQMRPNLERLLSALEEAGGDMARVAGVLANLMAGADSLTSVASLAGESASGVPSSTDEAANAI